MVRITSLKQFLYETKQGQSSSPWTPEPSLLETLEKFSKSPWNPDNQDSNYKMRLLHPNGED